MYSICRMGAGLLRSFVRTAKNDWRATDATKKTRSSYTPLCKVFTSFTDAETFTKKVHHSTNTYINVKEQMKPLPKSLTT
jgi:hypothetical protein